MLSTDLWFAAERAFAATIPQAGAVRRWALDLLPEQCAGRDDCALALTELTANAAEHGGPGQLTIKLVHGAEGLQLTLVQDGPPAGPIDVDPETLAELRLLAEFTGDQLIPDLRESGRGLLVVGALSGQTAEVVQEQKRTVIRLRLDGCRCGDHR
jgi:anti-sigma regulatory factor (Ser/Thr protein kinase)